MYFESIDHLLRMNGHGVYVWAAYGISLVVLLAFTVAPMRRYKKHLSTLGRRQRNANPTGAAGDEQP